MFFTIFSINIALFAIFMAILEIYIAMPCAVSQSNVNDGLKAKNERNNELTTDVNMLIIVANGQFQLTILEGLNVAFCLSLIANHFPLQT